MSLTFRPWTWAALGLFLLGVAASSQNGVVVMVSEQEDQQEEKKEPEPKRSVPTFGGSPSRNMVNLVEKNLVSDFAPDIKERKLNPKGEAKNLKWKQKLGGYAYGGPVIADGRIFVGTNNDEPRDAKLDGEDLGVVMCFRESDGEFLWQITHEKADEPNDSAKQGVISTPCVDGDRLYYVSNRGELVCADVKGDEKTKKGKILWSFDMVKQLDVYVGQASSSSPLILDDLVYVLTGNGREANSQKLMKPNAPALVAVNKKTGKKVWTNDLPGENVIRGQWSNPAGAKVGDRWQVIYTGGDGWLYGLDAKDGSLIWKFDLNPKKATPYKVGGGGEQSFVIATPVIHDGKCYVAVGQEPDDGNGVGRLWCIDITKKPANKDKDLSAVSKTIKVGDEEDERFDPKDKKNKDSGLVWCHGGKVLPRPDEGREYVFGRTLATVAVHDGVVYAAELLGFVQALDAKTGEKLWEHDFQSTTWCSSFYVDGKLYQGADDGLYVFAAGRKHNEPKKISFGGRTIKVPPVACNGVLYVNSGLYLYAFAAPEKKK